MTAKERILLTSSSAEQEQNSQWLMKAFILGDADAFSSIYTLYVNELFSYGMALGFEREELKDAIQDIFYRFYKNRKQLSHIREVKYYLLRMLKNYFLNLHRDRVELSELPVSDLSFSIKATALDEIIAEEDQALVQQKIDQLLTLLTDRQKEAIYLRFIQELEYEEIGQLLQMTPQATRKLVFRAIKRMRENQIGILFVLSNLFLQI